MIKGAKSIAEYAIRKWLETEGFDISCFSLAMEEDDGVVIDSTGASLRLHYDRRERVVYAVE